jgi:nitroimidazol reductase NimA-like FMN-containing flavoprotein (pyridoxamine 5'-phosphate oxidase superfamily)
MPSKIIRASIGVVGSGYEDPAIFLDILRKAVVCHIAMCADNVPYIVTMNFGIGNSEKDGLPPLYFHSSQEGKKIDILKKNNLICFQADIGHEFFLHSVSCGCSMEYQSIVGMGRMQFVDDLSEKIIGLQSIMTHYTKQTAHVFKEELVKRTSVLRLDIEELSAKGLVRPGR